MDSKHEGQGVAVKRWRGHQLAKQDAFNFFMENDVFSDVFVFCESHQFRLHRIVLAAGSEYFENVFSEIFQVTPNAPSPSVVIVANIRQEIFRYVIEYIYKGETSMKVQDLEEFNDAGRALKLRGVGNVAATSEKWTERDICPSDYLQTSLISLDNSNANVVAAYKSDDDDFKNVQGRFVPTFGAKSRFRPPVLKSGYTTEDSSQNSQVGNATDNSKKRKRPKQSSQNEPKTPPPPPKRRRGPKPRPIKEENVPEVVLADILDTISATDKSPETEDLVRTMVEEYEKLAEKSNSGNSKTKAKKRSAEDYEKLKASFEESLQSAVQDVLENLPIEEAATLYCVSVSAIRKRVRELKKSSQDQKSTPLTPPSAKTPETNEEMSVAEDLIVVETKEAVIEKDQPVTSDEASSEAEKESTLPEKKESEIITISSQNDEPNEKESENIKSQPEETESNIDEETD